MPKGIMVVQSRPSDPARENEFNDWYGATHVPEILATPGFVAARRYKVHDPSGGSSAHAYLAIYDLDADDLTDPVKQLGARHAAGEMHTSDALQTDPPPVVTIYEVLE